LQYGKVVNQVLVSNCVSSHERMLRSRLGDGDRLDET